jgi:redox-sensing transcriptional repressor
VGYHVFSLLAHVTQALGISSERPVVIVGAGHIGTALAAYQGLSSRGFRVVGVLDISVDRVGFPVVDSAQMRVRPLTELEAVVREGGVRIGVIATPAAAAQYVCDRLVQVGVRSILNFAPVTLAVPQDVEIRQVDLAVELQILAFHEQRRTVTIPECSA